jgi:DNA polymerase/3'-5' exonuclease PolX
VVQLDSEEKLFWLNALLGSDYQMFKATEKKIELTLTCDLRNIKVEITPTFNEAQFEVMKLIRTGSEEFNRQLVTRAHDRGMAVRFSGDDFGLFGAFIKGDHWEINPMRIEGKTEKEIIMKVFNDESLLDPANRNW